MLRGKLQKAIFYDLLRAVVPGMRVVHQLLRLKVTALIVMCVLVPALASCAVHKVIPSADIGEAPEAPGLQVGSLELKRCQDAPAYCGHILRPLDPTGQVAGTIAIGFQFYPRTDQDKPSLGTIVATEGGPGYATTDSSSSYRHLFRPLLDRRDLLLMDNRGTGKSQAINCELLQYSPYLKKRGIELCGAYLGDKSDLYGTALAVDDLAGLLDALDIGQIDLYGDSYGTFFSQTFASRHPERLRSMVLDGAYPVLGGSVWGRECAPAMRHAFNAACERSLSCRKLPGDSLSRIEALLESLRKYPFQAMAYDGDGNLRKVKADAANLAFLAFSNSTGPVVYRELDAAARVYLETGEGLPLLRLLAENRFIAPSGVPGFSPRYYSAGLFVAVSCTDYGQLYDMTLPTSERMAQRDAAFSREKDRHPGVFAPFSIDEYNGMPLDYSTFDVCLNWPSPSPAYAHGQPVPKGAKFTEAPVLVLSGEFDSWTPPKQGAEAAALFHNASHLLVSNSFHITAMDDEDHCASDIVRNFVFNLDPGDLSCAARIAEVRTVPKFALLSSELDPATPTAQNQGTAADLRVAAAAVLTTGDAIARWWMNVSGSGVGLRGGKFQYKSVGPNYEFELDQARFVQDVAVSGSMKWDYATHDGLIEAEVSLVGTEGKSGTLQIAWHDREVHARATITGQIGERKIAATMYAP